jgi:hypothetical protein
LFNWIDGALVMDNLDQKKFEVAGVDIGATSTGFVDNFGFGDIEVAAGASVNMIDLFDNDAEGQGSCTEALYVQTLTLEAGAHLTLDGCRVYYETLIDNGATITELGCGALVNIQCAIDAPLAELTDSCLDSADCPEGTTCIAGGCYAPRNRYLALTPANPGLATALRVTHPASARSWWVNPPDENGLATLSPGLLMESFRDWSLEAPVITISGCEIVPDTVYEIQAVAGPCDVLEAQNFSLPLVLPTASWGDVVGSFDAEAQMWTPPNGVGNFSDIQATVLGFQQSPTAAPIDWLDLEPQIPNGVVNFGDILQAVQGGFQSAPYPFSSPAECP